MSVLTSTLGQILDHGNIRRHFPLIASTTVYPKGISKLSAFSIAECFVCFCWSFVFGPYFAVLFLVLFFVFEREELSVLLSLCTCSHVTGCVLCLCLTVPGLVCDL